MHNEMVNCLVNINNSLYIYVIPHCNLPANAVTKTHKREPKNVCQIDHDVSRR